MGFVVSAMGSSDGVRNWCLLLLLCLLCCQANSRVVIGGTKQGDMVVGAA